MLYPTTMIFLKFRKHRAVILKQRHKALIINTLHYYFLCGIVLL